MEERYMDSQIENLINDLHSVSKSLQNNPIDDGLSIDLGKLLDVCEDFVVEHENLAIRSEE